MIKNKKILIGIFVIIILISVVLWIWNSRIIGSKYQKDIKYCEKDDDCRSWWGPDYCGCGNKYYKFPYKRFRDSLSCGGDANYECGCIDNQCI